MEGDVRDWWVPGVWLPAIFHMYARETPWHCVELFPENNSTLLCCTVDGEEYSRLS